mgnify:CR=1 FL=1
MPKARVIVADTDINYIIPLQLKFAEEFFDAIDLEIISDRSYFEELFASPQKADILVVSEELYDTSLQRHNISNIFLMTEQYEENQTAELNVNRIFKYTSIKEIFNEIIGKSASELKIQKENQKPKIVLVYSACGGTGKTTIAEEEVKGADRAEYGLGVIKKLAKELTAEYGKGFTKSNLYSFYSFYKAYPQIFQTASGKSLAALSWSHYAALLQVNDPAARAWYEQEAAQQTWSVRTLQRNISSQYYYRMLKTQKQALVEQEMQEKASVYQNDKLEFIKNPIVTEFLGLSSDTDFTESDLEKSILSNLQKFLMELGKGYAFVARQQHIHTEKQDYYIDLVFYNYILKCFVLIDLKTEKITHGDVGQMDIYKDCNVEEEIVRSLDIERVRAALKALTPEERDIIMNFYFSENPLLGEALAEKFATTKSSIYRRRDHALRKLKSILGNA